MDSTDRLDELVRQLQRKTDAGDLDWEPHGEDTFTVTLKAGVIILQSFGGVGGPVQMTVLDKQGKAVVETFLSDPRSAALLDTVKRKALGTDTVIDLILDELRSPRRASRG